MLTARLARAADQSSLLELFAASEVSSAIQPLERAERVWRETLDRSGVYVFVMDADLHIAATCMLVTAPNLLRRGRGHGFLNNVVAHPDFRGLGHGSAVVEAALAQAWATDCHHVLMQSGRTHPRVHRFYERPGFVPGRRTAYVASRTRVKRGDVAFTPESCPESRGTWQRSLTAVTAAREAASRLSEPRQVRY